MSTQEKCKVFVTFESEPHQIKRGDPTVVTLKCSASSRLFPYYLRQKLHKLKRIPPFEQQWTKLSETPLQYRLKVREREATQLLPLTIHGHAGEENKLQIDKQDQVIDIKFLLSPLVNNGQHAENIQLNYNTLRRLHDDEIMYETDCLNESIVIMFWFEFENKNPNESPIYQSVAHLIDINPLYPDMGTTIRSICNRYKNDPRQTFGSRQYIDQTDFTKRGGYEYINYKIINDRIDTISCALKYELGLNDKTMVGLCSINRKEWLLCDYACSCNSIVTVPLYPTLDANALQYITNHAQLSVIVTDSATVNDIIALLPKCKSLKCIVVMDDDLPDVIWKNSKVGQNILQKYDNVIKMLSDLEQRAKDNIRNQKYIVKDDIPATDSLYTIMYTSGTTGPPKGVMLTHGNFMAVLNGFLDVGPSDEDQGDEEVVHLSYLPLAHSMERMLNLLMFVQGYKIGFFSGSVDRLIEDMNVIKPIAFFGVPRVFQKIQDTVMNGINAKNAVIRWLFNYAYQNKIYAINNRLITPDRKKAGGFLEKYIFSKLFWAKINAAFGGKLKFIGSGSAPLSKELQEFLRVTLVDVVGEGYGLTETSAGGTGAHYFDLKYGHVGQPRTNISLKLVNVPDMNYLVTDKPCPRGEIWMKGATIFKGYFKNKKKTDEVLFSDGWFATGDVGLWRAEGRLQIIDRKKNIFKLSQGEYIRPEYIQNVYKLSRYIANIFVYGNSLQNYLVGIIVPDFEALQQIGFTKKDVEENNIDLIKVIKDDMKIQEEKAGLVGFEKCKKFKLKTEEFSNENGLLTISMKLKRNVARKRFEKELNDLYKKKSKL